MNHHVRNLRISLARFQRASGLDSKFNFTAEVLAERDGAEAREAAKDLVIVELQRRIEDERARFRRQLVIEAAKIEVERQKGLWAVRDNQDLRRRVAELGG